VGPGPERREREGPGDGRLRCPRERILDILDADARIPYVEKLGPWYYNFWRDAKNPRGLWRRTTLEEYRKEHPAWETVIDLDALGAAEKENWVWHGADCLKPSTSGVFCRSRAAGPTPASSASSISSRRPS